MHPKQLSLQLGLVTLLFAPLVSRAAPVSRTAADLEPGTTPACSNLEKTEGALVLATGVNGGIYLQLGKAIAGKAKDPRIEVCRSSGSVENIGLLAAGEADFALVQSDIAHLAWHVHEPFDALVKLCKGHDLKEEDREKLELIAPLVRVCEEHDLKEKDLKDLKLVAPLYAEPVHVLVRPHLHITSTTELKGKAVSLGPPGSGTEQTALAVLDASNLSPNDLDVRPLSLKEATEQVKDGTIDVMFWTGALATPLITKILDDSEVRLIRLERKVIERLVEGEGDVWDSIPKETYPNQKKLVPTVAVQAFLLARRQVDKDDVDRLVQILEDKQGAIEEEAGARLTRLRETVSKDLTKNHAHDGVRERLDQWRLMNKLSIALAIFVAIVVVGALIFLARHLRLRMHRTLRPREELLLALVVLFLILMAGSLGLYYAEGNVNEYFESFPKSAWSMLVYVAGAFEFRLPMTAEGEFVAVVVTVCGVAWVGLVAGGVATYFFRRGGRKAMPIDLKGHIVIVNWDERTKEMIQELHGPTFPEKKPIVVVSETGVELPDEDRFDDVFQVIGNPTIKSNLDRAHVQHAHSVTILSAWPFSDPSVPRKKVDADVSDTKTIMTLLAIREVCKKENEARKKEKLPAIPHVSITAEIKAQRNCEPAKNIGREGEIEIVCGEQFGFNILTQCAMTPGLATLYTRLLTFARETNEIYRTAIPKDFKGKTFGDVLEHYLKKRRDEKKLEIPIGISREGELYLNPGEGENEPGVLKREDMLFVISYKKPSK